MVDELLHFASRTNEFTEVVYSDPDFEGVAGQFQIPRNRQYVFAGFIGASCNLADVLVRSGNAYREFTHHRVPPNMAASDRFVEFARKWDSCEEPMERLAFLTSLWQQPIRELRRQGLLPDEALQEAAGLVEAGTGDLIETPAGLTMRTKDGRIIKRPEVLTTGGAAHTVRPDMKSTGGWEHIQERMRQATAKWDKVRRRLGQLTQKHGCKAALARYLGVTRSAVGEWLAGNNAPSSPTLLRLLIWIERAEADRDAGLATPAAPKSPRTKPGRGKR
jgi:hypothetical protein